MAQRRGRKIDYTRWERGAPSIQGLAAGTIGLNIRTAASRAETLLRTRGHLLAYLNATMAPPTFIDVAVAFLVVPEGTGATVTVSPGTDPDYPYFFYERFPLAYEEYVTDVIADQVATAIRIPIDVKAMRKIRPEEEIQMVVENMTIGGAASVNVGIGCSFLFGS